MKSKSSTFSSQILVLVLAAVVFFLMIQVARAQQVTSRTPSWDDAIKKSFKDMGLPGKNSKGILLAQGANQNSQGSGMNVARGNTLSMKMPQKSGLSKALEKVSLAYYQQFLGPTLSKGDQTYNVFQEGVDIARSGQAPMQSFHSLNLRYQFNPDWAIGSTLAMANGYTEEVRTRDGRTNTPKPEWFNARAYLSLPAWRTAIGNFHTTLSFEAPTSSISKNDKMNWGYVISENLAFNLPNMRWNAGLTGQIYRIYYKSDLKRTPGQRPVQLQTMIVTAGPYANYRFNDRWMLGSSVLFDWDQKGVQTGSREFGNNLPHRARVTGTYFPNVKYLTSMGLFAQSLLKYRPDTTVVGAEFGLRF